jgi:hypothetical protein
MGTPSGLCRSALAAVAAVSVGHPCVPSLSAAAESYAIDHVLLVDGTDAAPQLDATITVEGGRILSVRPFTPGASGVRHVDGRGLTAIPGLWDVHVHVAARPNVTPPGGGALARLFVANGITSVRDMGGDLAVIKEWRRARSDGETVPRIIAAGPIVDGPRPIWPQSLAVATAGDGRGAVDSLAVAGADFVKVYNLVPREAYFGVIEEAVARGLTVSGHVPASITASEASDAGQRTIEHLSGVLEECSRDEAALRRDRRQAVDGETIPTEAVADRIRTRMRRMLDTYDAAKCRALLRKFAANGTWQTPTLVSTRAFSRSADLELADDPRLGLVPLSIRRRWTTAGDFRLRGRDEQDLRNFGDLLAREKQIVGEMHRTGVPLAAGTDTPNPHVIPGFSLHDELELLVDAGLTPVEALRAATRDAAALAGVPGVTGMVRAGDPADIVLLDGNPLIAIRNTRRVAAVVINGEYLSRSRLDLLLEQAELDR